MDKWISVEFGGNVPLFINGKIFYNPVIGLNQLNLVLNLLLNATVLRQSILIVDPEKKCYQLMFPYKEVLSRNNIFYISKISDGFFTNKNLTTGSQVQKTPSIVLFFSVNKSIPLIIDLKKLGSITIGFVSKYTSFLDFSIYSYRFNSEFCYLVSVFLIFISQKGLSSSCYKKFLNEKSKL